MYFSMELEGSLGAFVSIAVGGVFIDKVIGVAVVSGIFVNLAIVCVDMIDGAFAVVVVISGVTINFNDVAVDRFLWANVEVMDILCIFLGESAVVNSILGVLIVVDTPSNDVSIIGNVADVNDNAMVVVVKAIVDHAVVVKY
ncbi:hypothetical protein NDU88_001885 [Pleurodeles waltl]|uniref:Uncharacterized protein n=1 Tax=Pleurodeles waltl TaxID=8319 RepID=A0AAV7Q846_PLEWA|nr:hypothetical protein NDU88_001885 [Pleurodeles waltl]